jgi:serine protease Do
MQQNNTQTILLSGLVSAVVGIVIVLGFGLVNSGNSSDQAEQTTSTLSAETAQTSNQGNDSSQVIEVVERVSPAVVSIVVRQDVPQFERYFERGPFGIRIPRQEIQGFENQRVGSGSGFFVSDDGLVVTNRHVVANSEATYSAVTSNGNSIELEVVDRDPFLDIAILQASSSTSTYPSLSFGDSDTLQPGQKVIAIGNALGQFQNTVSTGVISGLSRSIVAGGSMGNFERLDQVIQTDAAINPGNSGGPLLSLSGDVIGVNVAIAQGSENISFALPSNLVQEVVESVQEYGEIRRAFLGVQFIPITRPVREMRDLPVDQGALIVSGGSMKAVSEGSAADEAGLQEGDIITHFDGQKLTESRNLAAVIREYDVDDTVELQFVRDGEKLVTEATLQRAPEKSN